MNYLALIGDICGSRGVADREELQHTLQSVLEELNRVHATALASPFTITLGDEFQALLTTAKPIWEMVAVVEASLYPVRVRFGFGLGTIATAINPEAALAMDGPAFHHARDAMTVLKEEGGLFLIEGVPGVKLANHSLRLISELQSQWQHNRFKVYRFYLEGQPVQQIVDFLGISKTAVYKNINDGLLETFHGIQSAISEQLEEQLR
ncbi:MAG: SatD family protein [Haliea sp.]